LSSDLQSNINLLNFNGNYPQTNWGQFAQQAVGNKIDQMKIIGSIWSPPPWMKTTNNQNGGYLIQTPDNLTQFARYVAAYVNGFQQSYGVPMYGVSIQNELRFWQPYPSTVYSPSDYVAALKAVGAEFARDGITTKLIGPEDVGVDGGDITAAQIELHQCHQGRSGGQELPQHLHHSRLLRQRSVSGIEPGQLGGLLEQDLGRRQGIVDD